MRHHITTAKLLFIHPLYPLPSLARKLSRRCHIGQVGLQACI